MHEFAEEYVANLKPRDERYDTRLGDDFYVATFPNNVKTWVYVYQANGYTRRQTLGVYPEMPLEHALESLYGSRRTQAVEAELAEQGLDSTQTRQAEDSPIDLKAKLRMPIKMPVFEKRFLAGIATGVVASVSVAIAAWVFLAPQVITVASQSAAATQEHSAPATVRQASTTVNPTGQSPQSVATLNSKPAPAADFEPPLVDDSIETPSQDLADSTEEPLIEPGESELALRQLQEDMAGTLAWAQLTSAVKNGEPTDHLSWVVELSQKPKRVIYFVRVRGLAGGTVTYRWRHKGKLLKEDSVKVGDGWHSPAYSGITLTGERLGRWRVEVFGPKGQSLGAEEFETRMAKTTAGLASR